MLLCGIIFFYKLISEIYLFFNKVVVLLIFQLELISD